tara:strand:- start:781 stop:1740 length:960 start_codon:yes stop_codon:yes gene_type:complete
MKYLFTIISFLFSFYINAQTVDIKAVEQKGQLIYITYDLKGSPGTYNIKLFVKSNNGYSWSSGLKSVSGNVGSNQTVGSNKEIIWDVLKDRDEFQGDWIFGIEAVNITEKNKIANDIERKKQQKVKKEKLRIKETNSGKFSISYMGDVIRQFGSDISILPNKKIGGYLNLSSDQGNPSETNFTVDNQGNIFWSNNISLVILNNEISAAIGKKLTSGGITKKIKYPFWLYLGLGLSEYTYCGYYDTYFDVWGSTINNLNPNDYYDSRYVKNDDESYFEVIPQIGLYFKIKKMVVKSGLLISKNGIYGQFGLGILLFNGKG